MTFLLEGGPELTAFIRPSKDQSKIATPGPYSDPFIITEPYTDQWDVARSYVPRLEEMTSEIFIQEEIWQIPQIQYVHDKMKLSKLLWLPYQRQIEERLRQSQLEFYVCGSRESGAPKRVLIPLRTHWLAENPGRVFRKLDCFECPTFALGGSAHRSLREALGTLDGIHFFHFFERERKPVLAMQFLC